MADQRLWLVERAYTDKGLVSLVYATPDGGRRFRRQQSLNALDRGGATAAVEADPADLEAVADGETRRRYAAEAERMAADHDPDDVV